MAYWPADVGVGVCVLEVKALLTVLVLPILIHGSWYLVSALLYDAGRRRTVVLTFASKCTLRLPRSGKERREFFRFVARELLEVGARSIGDLFFVIGLFGEGESVVRRLSCTRRTGEMFLGVGLLV